MKYVLHLLALGFLFLAFSNVLVNDNYVIPYRDLLRGIWPAKLFWLESVREFSLPEWNPHLVLGHPFWADLKQGALSPFNLMLLFFSPEDIGYAISWFLFQHYLLMYCGFFLLTRKMNLDEPVAIIGACMYSLSGIALSAHSVLGALAAATVLPFFLLALLYWREEEYSYVSKSGLAMSLLSVVPLFSMGPEFSYFLILFLICVVLYLRPSFWVPRLVFYLFFIAGISLAATLPGYEIVANSFRQSTALKSQLAANTSMAWPRVLEFFLAFPFGNYIPNSDYWGNIFQNSFGKTPLFFSLYFGAVALPALIAFFVGYARQFKYVIVICCLLFFVSLGDKFFINLYGILYNYFPLWQLFRYPEKLLILVGFFISISITFGLHYIQENARSYFTKKTVLAWGGCALSIFILYYGLFYEQIAVRSQLALAQFFVFQFSLGLVFYICFVKRYAYSIRWLVLLTIVASDLLFHSFGVVWEQPKWTLASRNASTVLQYIENKGRDLKQGEAYRYSSNLVDSRLDYLPITDTLPLDVIGKNVVSSTIRVLPNLAGIYGLSDVNGVGILSEKEQTQFRKEITKGSLRKALNFLGAKFLLKPAPDNSSFYNIAVNKDAARFVFSPERVYLTSNRKKSVDRFLSQSFREKTDAILRESEKPGERNEVNEAGYLQNAAYRIENLHRTSKKISFSAVQKTVGSVRMVLVNESYHKNWKATANQKQVSIRRANEGVLGIMLPKDCKTSCLVEVSYFDYQSRLALVVSLGLIVLYTVILLLKLGLQYRRRKLLFP